MKKLLYEEEFLKGNFRPTNEKKYMPSDSVKKDDDEVKFYEMPRNDHVSLGNGSYLVNNEISENINIYRDL